MLIWLFRLLAALAFVGITKVTGVGLVTELLDFMTV